MLIDIIAGAHPDFIKIAPVIEAIYEDEGQSNITFRLIFTGQHKYLDAEFITRLGMPYPHISLEAGAGTEAEQTGTVMVRYEKVLATELPDMILLVGDTNTTLACAITARKAGIMICKLDAGLRDRNATSKEEANRLLIDSITDNYFTTSHSANDHLRRIGVPEERIFFTGNTIADSLINYRSHIFQPPLWSKLNMQKQRYFVVALHKRENMELVKLKTMLIAIIRSSQGLPIILPVYPETVKTIEQIGIKAPNLFITDFLDYFHFNFLLQHAHVVITDSGPIQELTTLMGVPCMTLGNYTEQEETIISGTNELIGTNANNIAAALRNAFTAQWKKGLIPYLWDGNAGRRVAAVLQNFSRHEALSNR